MTTRNKVSDCIRPKLAPAATGRSRGVPDHKIFGRSDKLTSINVNSAELMDCVLPAECHSKVRALAEYWLSICPANTLPGRQHFDPVRIRNLLPNIWLIDIHRDPIRLRFRLLGTRIVDYAGEDNTGKWLAEKWPEFDNAVLLEIARSGRPSWFRGPSNLRPEKDYYELERLRLPLARDGKLVDMILALTVFFDRQGKEII